MQWPIAVVYGLTGVNFPCDFAAVFWLLRAGGGWHVSPANVWLTVL
jgi:hypothetical protein